MGDIANMWPELASMLAWTGLFAVAGAIVVGVVGSVLLARRSDRVESAPRLVEPRGRRFLRIALAALWIGDGLLQAQPLMPAGFISTDIEPAVRTDPGWLNAVVAPLTRAWTRHPVAADVALIWLEIGIGVLLLVARRGRPARIAAWFTLAVSSAIVARALAKSPAGRYRDGREMAEALARAQLSAPPRPRHTAAHSGARTRQRPAARPSARVPAGPRELLPAPAPAQPRLPERPPSPRLARPSPPDTRRAELSPRHNVNPSGRRRSAGALALAFALLCAMSVAAVVVGAGGHVQVPHLTGLTRAAAKARVHRLSLLARFDRRYDAGARRAP